MAEQRFCKQCWRWRPIEMFVGRRGGLVVMCSACRDRYANWSQRSERDRLAVHPRMPCPDLSAHKVTFARSHGRTGIYNRKLGAIPVSMTDRSSCPTSCPLYHRGCFAEFHWLRKHWTAVPDTGMTWGEFCASVASLPRGQLWRHNECGDLPGKGEQVDRNALGMLVEAAEGTKGFTYTHKPLTRHLRAAIEHANQHGLCIAVSVIGLAAADSASRLVRCPVVAVVPEHAEVPRTTPKGRPVHVCQGGHGTTCAKCGLCARPERDVVVAFRAHGQWSQLVSSMAGAPSRLWSAGGQPCST